MLVKFIGADGMVRSPIWIEADLVRIVAISSDVQQRTVIYQQDSDTPLYVAGTAEEVVRAINEGKTNAGTDKS